MAVVPDTVNVKSWVRSMTLSRQSELGPIPVIWTWVGFRPPTGQLEGQEEEFRDVPKYPEESSM